MKLILAPLKGFTDATFRNAFSHHFDGFDCAVAPFISTVQGNRVKASKLKGLLPENNRGMPVIPQVLTKSPEDFIPLARTLFDMGHAEINWNLGCPFPMVAKKGRGSGMLPHPDRVADFLDKTVAAIPNRLSIKTRLGRNRADEIFKILPIFNAYPLAAVTIHPRTGKQMYSGHPDLEAFENCLELSAHPVIYNGDMDTPEKFAALSGRFKAVGAWMLGRGALIDPFLPGTIKRRKAAIPDKVGRFAAFHDDLFEGYAGLLSGPGHMLARMKGFWKYFSLAFINGKSVAKRIHRAKKVADYRAIVDEFFADEAEWAVQMPGRSIHERFHAAAPY